MDYLKFDKYQGCGNDFIIIEEPIEDLAFTKNMLARLCDRHFGIGADGMAIIAKQEPGFSVRFFNADGSQAEMSGNGIRCVANYLKHNGLLEEGQKEVELSVGPTTVTASFDEDEPGYVSVKFPPADFDPEAIGLDLDVPIYDEVIGYRNRHFYHCGVCQMGAPHMVFYNVKHLPFFPRLGEMGKYFSTHELFEKGVNVDFVEVFDEKTIQVRTYERGNKETKSCGTGACAAVSVLYANEQIGPEVEVITAGGKVFVKIEPDGVVLKGPAQKLFSGMLRVDPRNEDLIRFAQKISAFPSGEIEVEDE